nr:MFS transporter [Acanthopleuribacter pedis]
MLTCLYACQGLPYGFFTQSLPVIMRENNATLTQIGLAYLLLLPWAGKFLWAPLVDEYGSTRIGRRKTWLFATQTLSVLLLCTLGLFGNLDGDGDYRILFFLFAALNFLAATQDIATDGIAVNLLNTDERGIGNGIQVAGYRLGMIVGGAFLLAQFSFFGWSGSFFFMAAVLTLWTLPLVSWREPPPDPKVDTRHFWVIFTHLWRQPGFPVWLAMIAFFKVGEAMSTAMLSPYFKDQGLAIDEIAVVLGGYGFTGGLIGSLVGGFAVLWLGRIRAVVLLGVAQIGGVALYLGMAGGWLPAETTPWLVAIEHGTSGMVTTALFTVMMDVCQKETASSDYTLQASAVVIATGFAKAGAGRVADLWGYQTNFTTALVLCTVGVLWFAIQAPRLLDGQGQLRR